MSATRLDDFITFVRERVVDGLARERGELADFWRAAADRFADLQDLESGAADQPEILPLPPRMQAGVDALVELPAFQQSFSLVPVAFGLVELDKLVVYQQFITQSSVDEAAGALADPIDDLDLLRLCLPADPPAASLRLARQDGNRFVFIADNHDARFLGARLLEPARIDGLAVAGHACSVLALPFGFTTNVMNVVRHGSRMVLNNGYHRAAALRRVGVRHAPCVIQVCRHLDDVAVAGAGAIHGSAQQYFSGPRPPMFKDFFDPVLSRVFPAHRLRKEIRVSFQVDTLKLAV